MTKHVKANPYAAPKSVARRPTRLFPLLGVSRLALATLGVSLLTLTVFGSLVWDGKISLFPLHDQAHLISLATSTGLAVCASLAQILGRMTRFQYGSIAIFTILVATAIAYLAWTTWPVAIQYTYFDLSDVFALYACMAFFPAFLVSTPVARAKTGLIAFVSFATLITIVLYASLR